MVELLMVLAVFMILISLLSPSLQKLVESSNTAQCKNNLKTIYTGAMLWSDDNDGWIIPSNWRGNKTLHGYIGASPDPDKYPIEYLCPTYLSKFEDSPISTYGVNANAVNSSNPNSSPGDPVPNYSTNSWGEDYVFWSKHGRLKINTIRRPSKIMYFMDLNYFFVAGWSIPYAKSNLAANYSLWHTAWFSPTVSNMSFFDGHVDFEPMDIYQNWRSYLYDPQ